MFRYTDTKKLSKPKESQRKVITEVREVTYLNYHPDEKVIEPVVSTGYEIVTEKVVSPEYPESSPVVSERKTVDARFNKDGSLKPRKVKKEDKRKLFLNDSKEETNDIY